jgi:hypothetical protein
MGALWWWCQWLMPCVVRLLFAPPRHCAAYVPLTVNDLVPPCTPPPRVVPLSRLQKLSTTDITKESPSPLSVVVGGAAGGAAYWLAFYPADTVKSSMQVNPSTASFWRIFMDIYRKGGAVWWYGCFSFRFKELLSAGLNCPVCSCARAVLAVEVYAIALLCVLRCLFGCCRPSPCLSLGAGLMSLYAGALPTVLRAIPGNIAVFACYEYVTAMMRPL